MAARRVFVSRAEQERMIQGFLDSLDDDPPNFDNEQLLLDQTKLLIAILMSQKMVKKL